MLGVLKYLNRLLDLLSNNASITGGIVATRNHERSREHNRSLQSIKIKQLHLIYNTNNM